MVLCFLLEDLPDPKLLAASSGCGEKHRRTPLLALLSPIPALSAASLWGVWALRADGPLPSPPPRTKPCANAPIRAPHSFHQSTEPQQSSSWRPHKSNPSAVLRATQIKGKGRQSGHPAPITKVDEEEFLCTFLPLALGV